LYRFYRDALMDFFADELLTDHCDRDPEMWKRLLEADPDLVIGLIFHLKEQEKDRLKYLKSIDHYLEAPVYEHDQGYQV
jgi:hypothetical protein